MGGARLSLPSLYRPASVRETAKQKFNKEAAAEVALISETTSEFITPPEASRSRVRPGSGRRVRSAASNIPRRRHLGETGNGVEEEQPALRMEPLELFTQGPSSSPVLDVLQWKL